MSFSTMRGFDAATIFCRIRAAVNEPEPRGYTRAQYDPWAGADPRHETAFIYDPQVVAW